MKDNTPNILLLKSLYHTYFYDVNKNKIVRIPQEGFEYLKDIKVGKEQWMINAPSCINRLVANGFLTNKRIKIIQHPRLKELEECQNRKVVQLTLQLTQGCNFRCSYCIYSENNNQKQRNHSSKRMSYETGKKCIDFYAKHSVDNPRANIGFYGGEPLLEFQLIKKLVAYAERVFDGKPLSYNMTTNGSLLSNEVVEFLLKYKVRTTISLDGPKEIHDMNRRFAHNGMGTFDTIFKNLENIKENYPEFLQYISFNVVMDPENNFADINSVFNKLRTFEEIEVHSTIIDDTYSDEKIRYSEQFRLDRDYELFKAYLYYFGRLEKDDIMPISLQEIDEKKKLKAKLDMLQDYSEVYTHAGPCLPGVNRLFATVEGKLYPCERVSEKSEVMCIGNIEDGFDIKKSIEILDIGKLTAEACKNCFAIHNCNLCAKYADNSEELNGELLKKNCRGVMEKLKYDFLDLIMLEEIEEIKKEGANNVRKQK